MSGWLKTCVLHPTTVTRDSRGVATDSEGSRVVVCNPFSMGAQSYYQAASAGIHPVAVIQLHKCDYDSERLVTYDGARLNVERVDASSPDFVVLTLTERLADHG